MKIDREQVETLLRGCISKQDAILHLKNHLANSNYRNYIIGELKKLNKIEQIVKDYDTNCGLEEYMYLEQIKEVLEQE